MHNLTIYLITLAVFLAIDMVWLGILAKDLYRKQIGKLMAKKPNWTAAFIFYAIYILGLFLLVIYPAVQDKSGLATWWKGLVFGVVSFATYDLTNLAVAKDWPVKITLIDLVWGGAVTSLTTLASLFLFAR
jgi:hypothetical protein